MAELKTNTKPKKIPLLRAKGGAKQHKLTSNRLEILVTIVNRGKADFFMDLIQSYEVNMQFSTSARGTADISILNRLGITDTDKTVIFSVVKAQRAKEILELLSKKFETIKNGNGIAYTIPMSSIIGASAFAFLANQRQEGLFDGTN
jgi:hypothetical protein